LFFFCFFGYVDAGRLASRLDPSAAGRIARLPAKVTT